MCIIDMVKKIYFPPSEHKPFYAQVMREIEAFEKKQNLHKLKGEVSS